MICEPLVLEGPIAIWSQEGGYASPSVSIGDEDITDVIEGRFLEYADDHKEIGKRAPGRWRLTLERIAE